MQPRLGPKPFTPPKFNETESFDKVFSVPVLPGITTSTNGLAETKDTTPTAEAQNTTQDVQESEIAASDANINGKTNLQPEESEYIPKTPSTAERRKLFENRSNSKENEQENNCEVTDAGNNFERNVMQRSSIAERRKLYERSQSVQDAPAISEKPDGSPIMLRRKDSFKNRKGEEENKTEVNRKSVPFAKQQSLDPQAHRKSEVVTPTPKRTSTVFGE